MAILDHNGNEIVSNNNDDNNNEVVEAIVEETPVAKPAKKGYFSNLLKKILLFAIIPIAVYTGVEGILIDMLNSMPNLISQVSFKVNIMNPILYPMAGIFMTVGGYKVIMALLGLGRKIKN